MTYQQTLDFLFNQLPMFQRIGKQAFKKDLTNIRLLCEALDQPQNKYPTIHIAGTNGKGSTAHILAAILQAYGLKVGLYTSPHYKDFRERIKINGQLATEQFVIGFVATHQESWKTVQPSFFEITVAMAFEYFAQEQVDVAIIETGLGGIYDSTNIVQPILSIITNISYDHQNILGDTLPKIATSKAGIIKPDTPVVVGERQLEVENVFLSTAESKNAPIYFASDHFEALPVLVNLEGTEFDVYKNHELLYEELQTQLYANYQYRNLQTVLQAVELLPYPISEKQLRLGLKNIQSLTRFIGRWQILGSNPTIICDSAHNEAGIELSMSQLLHTPHEALHIVMGVVKDKDLSKMLPYFPEEATYYFAKADIPRGLDTKILKEKARDYGLLGENYASVVEALEAAKSSAKKEDLIYVGGSIFVVAEVI